MEAVGSNARFYGQKNKRLIKKIDSKWVDALYDAIPALDEIVNKPRKFIEREEVIVPVDLSRKVGADSVKHLSTHTHFISQVDGDGGVVPSKIMNIYNEESFNLYENRFIFCLIKKACLFVDHRYDALVGMAGDEFESVLKVESSFNDNDETVDYSLSLRLHQGSEYLESKGDNAEVLKKIEHIRAMYTSFKRSEFYQELVGSVAVKSPISRTNLIMKNPRFKKCYNLWNFLEKYTKAGYSIEEQESDGDFSPEYVDELNAMILFSYLVMKNNMEIEHNKHMGITGKKLRVIKPKINEKEIEETDPGSDFGNQKVKEPEQPPQFNPTASENKESAIFAALSKALGDERIIRALEKALRVELGNEETEIEEERLLFQRSCQRS